MGESLARSEYRGWEYNKREKRIERPAVRSPIGRGKEEEQEEGGRL